MGKNNENDLKALQDLENANKQNNEEPKVKDIGSVEIEKKETVVTQEKIDEPNILDGYKKINREDLPHSGELYPDNWEFAYRCPTSKEVANFSTLSDNDQPGIMVAIEELIKKCVIIFDTETETKISSGEINDGHRVFFILLLREFYLPGDTVISKTICETCHETWDSGLKSSVIEFAEISDALLNSFNGRNFELEIFGENINFYIPTLSTTGKIFRYIIKTYRNANTGQNKKQDAIVYDKQFLLLSPYLFKTGRETIKDIIHRYKTIQKNENLFKAYLEVANKFRTDNEETYEDICPKCESEGVVQIRFQQGWKKLFITTTDSTGYFG